MFSVRSFTRAAMRASSAIASSRKTSATCSVASSAAYCRMSAFSGSVRMRMKSACVSASSSTRIEKRPSRSARSYLNLTASASS